MFRTGATAILSILLGGLASPIGWGWVQAGVIAPEPLAFAATPAIAAPSGAAGVVRLARQPDGLFHVPVTIDGKRYAFIVDTGASVTVLTAADARRLGLPLAGGGRHGTLRTAGGSSAMRWATIGAMRVAGREFRDVDVAIVEQGPTHSLLGQDILSAIGVLRIEGDALEIS